MATESLFEVYEKQFGNLTSEITSNLGKVSKASNDDRRKLMHETSILFGETKDLLEQMTLECQEIPTNSREKYKNRLQCYRKDLDELSAEYRNPRYAGNQTRHTSYKPGNDDDESLREEVLYDSDMRASLLENTDRVARSTNLLEDGLRTSLYTQELGDHILSDLGEQREKFQRSRDRLRHVDGDLQRSSRILTEMTRRILKNRVVISGIVFFMIIIFIVAFYLSSRRSSPEEDAPIAMAVKQPPGLLNSST